LPDQAIAERLIDVPIESLPYVDEHSTTIASTPERVWEALLAVAAGFSSGARAGHTARALGCAHTEVHGAPGEIGSTVPGFVVTRAVRPAVLALMGEHRFSRYALIFTSAETTTGLVRLTAETRAEFPGARGAVYRTLVIRSRAHVLVTRSLLRSIRRRAERR
jgi:hypothetical protein